MKRRNLRLFTALCAVSLCQFCSTYQAQAENKIEPLWGYVDPTGKMVIEPKFAEAGTFCEGLAPVGIDSPNGEFHGYIDTSGKMAIEAQFEQTDSFSEGLAAVRIPDKGPLVDKYGADNARKWGFIDKTGKFVIDPQYESADGFSEGLASVCMDGKCGYIDKAGKWVITPKFDRAYRFVNDRAAVMTNEGTGMLSIRTAGDMYRADGGHWNYINKKGEMVIGSFEECGAFGNGVSPVALGKHQGSTAPDKWGYVDKNGKFVIKPRFNNVHVMSEGKAAVQTGTWQKLGSGYKSWNPGKWGYINAKGKQVISSQFDAADPFSEGMAAVMVDGKWGYIDSSGKIVIKPQYDGNYAFSEKLAAVRVRPVLQDECQD